MKTISSPNCFLEMLQGGCDNLGGMEPPTEEAIKMKKVRLVIVFEFLVLMLVFCGCIDEGHHEEAEHMHEHEVITTQPHEHLSGEIINGAREIKVEAIRFAFNPNIIVVKKDERVRIIAKSKDATHGFGIEALNINQVLPPHEEKVIEFTPDKAGEFHIHCTVYCGVGHGEMHGKLVVKE